MRENIRLIAAVMVCLSPFVMTALMGKESFFVFTSIMAVSGVCFVVFCGAHWAIETVLVALGLDREQINKDRPGTTFIFWR